MNYESKGNVDLKHEIEELRKLIAAPKDQFNVLQSSEYFRKPFFASPGFLEHVKPLGKVKAIDSIMDCFFMVLESMSDACYLSISKSACSKDKETNLKGTKSGLPIEVDLLALSGSDFIHGYIYTKDFQTIILYFANDGVGLINMSFQEEETAIARFFTPDLEDRSKSWIDMSLRMKGGFYLYGITP